MDITPSDLASYLGVESIDEYRAAQLLGFATQLCESIITPLPATATAVVLAVAARIYTNPVPVGSQTVGPYAVGGVTGGVALTRGEERALRRLSGGGGAFTIETCPATAGQNLPPWDVNGAGYLGDFDQIPS